MGESIFFITDYRTGIALYKISLSAKRRLFTQDQSIESHWIITMNVYNNIGVIILTLHFNENSLLDLAGDMVSNIINRYGGRGYNYSDLEQDMSYYTIHYESIDLSQNYPMDDEEDSIVLMKFVHRTQNMTNTNKHKVLEFYMTNSMLEDFIMFIEEFLNELNFQYDNGEYFSTAGIWEV